MKVGIVGVAGYAGTELLKVLLNHPQVKLTWLADQQPSEMMVGGRKIAVEKYDAGKMVKQIDLVFLALPHTVSAKMALPFLDAGKKVIDLSADFRLREPALYRQYYNFEHDQIPWLKKAVYGMPELYREKIRTAHLIANPGCYPTAAILSIAPALKNRVTADDDIIIDAKSGVSGAGRALKTDLLFVEVNESIKAYKVGVHQHQPEIVQEAEVLSGHPVNVIFTPHLIPVTRGILSVAYLTLKKEMPTATLLKIYRGFYAKETFVKVLDEGQFPSTGMVINTNYCAIGMKVTGKKAIVISAIDNLLKGASGQAVQNMNLICGFPEETGL